ncbi:hypothetical protein B0H14DRAFT_2607264 [Mycena olivaceomarginata]|nr:hypothetical protein B0H14DRAFT_2607264 [Mycena olivaceomarginata]
MRMSTFATLCKGCLLVYDLSSRCSFDSVYTWLADVCVHANVHVSCILVGNKVDLFFWFEGGEKGSGEMTWRDGVMPSEAGGGGRGTWGKDERWRGEARAGWGRDETRRDCLEVQDSCFDVGVGVCWW